MKEQVRDFRAWIVTGDQADKIVQGDEAAAARFFRENYDKLRRMAFRYARKNNTAFGFQLYDCDEMLNQLYLDLPCLDWKDGARLTYTILYNSFRWSPHGGYTQRLEMGLPIRERVKGCKEKVSDPFTFCLHMGAISTETPLEDTDGEKTLSDIIAAPREYEVDYIPPPIHKSPKELVDILYDLFNPAERVVLALFLEGKNYAEISQIRGVSITSASSSIKRVRQKLVVNYREIVQRLLANGVYVPIWYQIGVPDNLAECAAALEKHREQGRAHSAEMREKARRAAQATAAKSAPSAV